ncbi:unannotated protein [freshwater metagenome]|uniref:Unannotated protein n=1 Tax=freshwater metagenome TaxID=449393 RepID=A0A6J7FM80_9ZZZZ|nr:VUT family protein [Actinomycetota bacterium]
MRIGLAIAAVYVAAIVTANIVTATQTPWSFDALGQHWVVTWGTWFIAATFVLRDLVQLRLGRAAAYAAVGAALLANVAVSFAYDDLLWVTVASALSFALAETLDTEVFTRLHGSVGRRVAVSGVLGGTLDSILFAVVGLSPLTTGIVSWEFLWTVVVAQVVVKAAVSAAVGLAWRDR